MQRPSPATMQQNLYGISSLAFTTTTTHRKISRTSISVHPHLPVPCAFALRASSFSQIKPQQTPPRLALFNLPQHIIIHLASPPPVPSVACPPSHEVHQISRSVAETRAVLSSPTRVVMATWREFLFPTHLFNRDRGPTGFEKATRTLISGAHTAP